MAFSIKPTPKEGCYIVRGSDVLEQAWVPIGGFIWDDQDGYWKHSDGSHKIELFKYYALPNNFKVEIKSRPEMLDIREQCWEYTKDWAKEAFEQSDREFIKK